MIPSYPLLFLFSLLFSSLLSSCHEQQFHQCDGSFSFINSTMTKNITYCKKLHSLGAELGWNVHNTTTNTKNTSTTNAIIDIVFSAKLISLTGWVAWGVNPNPKPKMVGTRALIAIVQPNGSPVVATYNVTGDVKNGCKLQNSTIEVVVENMSSQYSGDSRVMTVWATVGLPPAYNTSRLNIVWQVGANAVGMMPMMHEMRLENFDSTETIDLMTGKNLWHTKRKHREDHGILSVIGWGFFSPIGIIVARYFKTFPFELKRWFIFHVSVQLLGYLIGTAAWGIGLSLIYDSRHHKTFIAHRIIGIMIFCLATLQITALWLKPNKIDKYRKYWSIYHHTIGYAVVALAVVNIFKGLAILRPPVSWKWAYIGILSGLSCVALLLEIVTWAKFCWKVQHEDKIKNQSQQGDIEEKQGDIKEKQHEDKIKNQSQQGDIEEKQGDIKEKQGDIKEKQHEDKIKNQSQQGDIEEKQGDIKEKQGDIKETVSGS